MPDSLCMTQKISGKYSLPHSAVGNCGFGAMHLKVQDFMMMCL